MTMAKGGNVKKTKATARVEIAKKSALVALDTPNAPLKPKVLKAENMDDALSQLNVNFKTKLNRLDGSAVKEKLEIKSLDDFEESTIVRKSDTLRELKQQMLFLHDFQEKLNDEAFLEELKDFLESEKKDKLILFLREWAGQLKQPSPRFLDLLQAGT
ncbi:MAG: type VI secretion system contractile sheath small subunit [Bacteroidota bacterium]